MTDEQLAAVRQVKQEANNLRLACVAAAKTASLLHVAYDREVIETLPVAEAILLQQLGTIQ